MALLAPILALASLQPAPSPESEPAVHLCALIHEQVARGGVRAEWVSITALIAEERHHGLYLDWWPRCANSVANTGILHITLPDDREFPALERLRDRDFLAASLGKRIYCTCVGVISYANGVAHFALQRVARVWASNDSPRVVFLRRR